MQFTVVDTGVGIPDDKLLAIFEAFQQADGTTSRKYGGTGPRPVDLAGDRAAARRRDHGLLRGRDRQPLLSLFLPMSDRPLEAPPEPAAPRPRPSAANGSNGSGLPGLIQVGDDSALLDHDDRVILVIASSPDRAETLVELVHARGVKAVLARRPSASLGLAREHRPEVVLLAGEEPRAESVLGAAEEPSRHSPPAGGADRRPGGHGSTACARARRRTSTSRSSAAELDGHAVAARADRRGARAADRAGRRGARGRRADASRCWPAATASSSSGSSRPARSRRSTTGEFDLGVIVVGRRAGRGAAAASCCATSRPTRCSASGR